MRKQGCTVCKKRLPLTSEYWHRNPGSRTGFAWACKVCSNKRNRANIKKKKRPDKDITVAMLKKNILHLRKHYILKTDEETFKAKLVGRTDNLLIFERRTGVKESFMKVDYHTGDLECKEVKK